MKIIVPAQAHIHKVIMVTEDQYYTICLEEYADLTYFFVFTTTATLEVTVQLTGSGATARLYGIYLLQDHHLKVVTRQEHYAPHASSTVLIKGVLNGTARIHHQGLIAIKKEAVGSTAYQHNKNIALSPASHTWAQPSLEVLTHDVHCAHGSATGQLDENQLYYLQARGIRPEEAKTLLLKGFFADILQEVGDPLVEDVISKKIHGYFV